ncbi:MAG: tRNA dihydrouridine(20/20a) synthase DusA [Leptospiraceae bacterium]|nr:tRNA dihydrouridine(20/20a) synthase DusA [Leptospiraceae bacterium]MDW8305842.1 tRNA dihydrouridine(20/20a) synthase DusA [Leptospiraceae bacterium]
MAKLTVDHRLSIAPMMGITDRHFRYLMRLISKKVVLYSEMIHARSLVYGNVEKLLRFHPLEKPVVLQLGGDEVDELCRAAELGEKWGYDEINLNCGCPSPRVQAGCFGIMLMHTPKKTGQLIRQLRKATSLPLTVKHRLGSSERHGYEFLSNFAEEMLKAGAQRLIVHARLAFLGNVSPKKNREVPPLDYEQVYRLKEDFPEANIHLNGGVKTYEEISFHLRYVDGVMIGRLAAQNPYFFHEADFRIFSMPVKPKLRREILREYLRYALHEYELTNENPRTLLKPLLVLWHGVPHARLFRRMASENIKRASFQEICHALEQKANDMESAEEISLHPNVRLQ